MVQLFQASRAAEKAVRTPFHPRTPHEKRSYNRNQGTERNERLPDWLFRASFMRP